jgi:hypothetical protein
MSYNEFLFSSGDGQKWLIADKDEVIGDYYASMRNVKRSSSYNGPCKRWFARRQSFLYQPYIDLDEPISLDANSTRYNHTTLYMGNGMSPLRGTVLLVKHGGARVYIRLCEQITQPVCQEMLKHIIRTNSTANYINAQQSVFDKFSCRKLCTETRGCASFVLVANGNECVLYSVMQTTGICTPVNDGKKYEWYSVRKCCDMSVCPQLNKCNDGTHKCKANANCVSYPGSYTCSCKDS